MSDAHSVSSLRELVVFLVIAGIIVPFAHRQRISPVLGYLIVGTIVGPYGLGRLGESLGVFRFAVIDDIDAVKRIGELGVVFLLFMIGLDLSIERLWSLRRLVFGFGGLQVIVSAAAIGLIAAALGAAPRAALVVGTCLALSSTAVVTSLLIEQRRFATPVGRASFAVLLFQDLAVVPILVMLSVLGEPDGGGIAAGLMRALIEAAAMIVLIVAVGRTILRPAFRMVAGTRLREVFMALTLLASIGAAALTGMVGLSMALGAFLAGLLLAESEYRHQVAVDIEPFKGLLLGAFFLSVGMGIDPRQLAVDWAVTLAAVAGLIGLKAAIAVPLGRAFGLPWPVAVEAGIVLGQGGEFAFVVVGLAAASAILDAGTAQFVLAVVSLSMLVTPALAAAGRGLAARLARPAQPGGADAAAASPALEGHAIIAGFGRVGRMAARVLDAQRADYIALDRDDALVEGCRAAGQPVYFGDASVPTMLERVRAGSAHTLIVTMDDPAAVERTVRAARERWPQLRICARARDFDHAQRLIALGATAVVQEAVELSLQLAGQVLEGLGVPDETVSQLIDQERELTTPEAERAGRPAADADRADGRPSR
ncbi:MAG: cation:proton antiporter [Alphaproteobacteria bacterium]|nr:cation:proton antiporter [Alphaproteobacteria bacterium]